MHANTLYYWLSIWYIGGSHSFSDNRFTQNEISFERFDNRGSRNGVLYEHIVNALSPLETHAV